MTRADDAFCFKHTTTVRLRLAKRDHYEDKYELVMQDEKTLKDVFFALRASKLVRELLANWLRNI